MAEREAVMGACLPPPRPTLIARIRSTLRSPAYRAEVRQAGQLNAALLLLGSLLFLPILMVMPGALAGRGLRRERERGILEGMLLTPGDRAGLLWAKLLAALRPTFWFSAACPLIGAIVGGFVGPGWAWALLGFAAGIGAGILILGEAFTLAPLGIYFDLRFRSWLASDVLWGVTAAVFHGLELGVFAILFALGLALADFNLVLGVALLCLIVLVRLLLVNILVPEAVMAHCAAQFDRLTLRHLAKES